MRSNREDILKRAGEAVRFAKGLCPNVEFSPMDATRTDIGFLSEVVAARSRPGPTSSTSRTPSATRRRSSSPPS
jgi:2-isopropylmalate synthase